MDKEFVITLIGTKGAYDAPEGHYEVSNLQDAIKKIMNRINKYLKENKEDRWGWSVIFSEKGDKL